MKRHSDNNIINVCVYAHTHTYIQNDLPWKQAEIILSFLRLHPSTEFWALLLTMRAISFLLRDS